MPASAPAPAAPRPWVAVSLARFGIGAFLAWAPSFASHEMPSTGALAVLDWSSAIQIVNALVGGPAAWLGGVIGELASFASRGAIGVRQLSVAAALSLPGLAAYLLFFRSRRFCRSLPDLPSYLALLAIALGFGAASGVVASWVSFGRLIPLGALLWSAGLTSGTLLVVPPLLFLAEMGPFRLLVPETRRPGSPAVAPLEHVAFTRIVIAFVATIGLAILVVVIGHRVPAAEAWLNLLLVVPVVWAAEHAGLRGGVAVASIAGVSLLALRTLLPATGPTFDAHLDALAILPPLLLFSLLGALRGAAWDRERALAASLRRANEELREELEQSVRALSSALEAKDAYTDEHVSRVADYALALGDRLGLGDSERVALGWAARLHDLGKIGIPEQILNKPAPLDADERELVRRHPEIGAKILSNIPGMADAAPLVLHHQERWDGRTDGAYPGYPSGLTGDAIPLGARIIAVVDAFDAMTSDRPYRPARPVESAMEELRRQAGRQFDPRVVGEFLELLPRRPWA